MATSASGSTADTLLLRVSGILTDQASGMEYASWSKNTLAGFLTEGLCQLLALRPDAFSGLEDIALAVGSPQTLPDTFHALINIEDADTTDSSDDGVMRSDSDIMRRFGKASCLSELAAGESYAVKTFSVNTNVKGAFSVSPPVPAGTTVSVRATVIRLPVTFTSSNLTTQIGVGCEYEAPLVDWMLARAYGTETESASSASLSRSHRDAFYAAFNTNYLQARRFQSGFYLGKEGSGDDRFRVH